MLLMPLTSRADPSGDARLLLFPNASGMSATFSTNGAIDGTNPFFQALGTNGRSCASCHQASDGWTITPATIQDRFRATRGLDPIFRMNDGANSPNADASTVAARRSAFSMLLTKGLIRVGIGIPADAEFVLESVDDPYGYASAAELSLFRRPLPAANLKFLSTVMWDGRETVFGAIPGKSIDLRQSLLNQAKDATTGHAQGLPPTTEQLSQIVAFETGLSSAQVEDRNAGNLTAQNARGGPLNLSQQNTYIGINDSLGGDPTGAAFDPNVFTIYSPWAIVDSPARQSVARGEDLFNNLPIPITGVGGLNDALNQSVIMGTCTTCHDTPNAGNHSFSVPLAIGTTAYPAMAALDIAGLPIYTIQCKATGAVVHVTDPGRAMISGKCNDIGKLKGPVLRGLAARAPYFHNGAAATLEDAVEFYDQRFNLNLTSQQKADLVAFLRTL